MCNSFIKVHNSLFGYKLSSSAFVVYLYLSDISRHTGNAKVRYEVIADKCNMSPKTAYRAVRELATAGLIEKRNRYGETYLFSTNIYTVKQLSGGFSRLDRRVFRFKLDPGAMYVLCAINRFTNKHSRAFPSYNKIADETGLSRSTAIRKISFLQEQGLIAKESRLSDVFYKYISNAYAVIKMELRAFLFLLILKYKQIKESIATNSDNASIFMSSDTMISRIKSRFIYFFTSMYTAFKQRLNI